MPAAVRTSAGIFSDERSPVAHVATTSAPNGGRSTHCVIHEACGARVIGIPSCHDDAGGAKRGKNLLHIIEADGLRIAHLGDLGHLPDTDEQRQALSGLDVMLIPIGGFFTIDTPAAVRLIETCKPRCAIAMHFANAYCHFPVSDESEFVRLTGTQTLPNEIELTKAAPIGCAVMEI